MRDWILGLQKGAAEKRPGLESSQWSMIEADAGKPVPSELRALYETMNGARLHPDVQLIPFGQNGDRPGVVEQSRSQIPGLPEDGVWQFGVKGSTQELFAVRKADLMDGGVGALPGWVDSLPDEQWVYGIHRSSGDHGFYKSLEELISHIVPPAETEEIGENTFVRALSAVQGALDDFDEEEGDIPVPTRKPKPAAKRPAKKAAKKKAAPPKKAASKKSAKKAAKPKKAAKASKKRAVKKPAKRAAKKSKKSRR
jgi:hypothetical protein